MIPLDNIEDVGNYVIEIIREGLEQRPSGVHLTYVGSQFSRGAGASFEQYINHLAITKQIDVPQNCRKLAPFVDRFLKDRVVLTRDELKGTDIAKLAISNGVQATSSFRAVDSVRLYKRPVWAAFVRPLPDGYRRFLNVEDMEFKDAERKPPGSAWKEIQKELIAGIPIDQPIDGPLVQANIGKWSELTSTDLDILAAEQGTERNSGPSIYDLYRIINALPTDVSSRWSIPADVIRYLRIR